MKGCTLNTSGFIVFRDCDPQRILGQELTELIAKQIVFRAASSDCHVLLEDGNHGAAKRDKLDSTVFRVSHCNLSSLAINILNLNISHGSSSTTAVEKKIDDNPIPKLTEVAVCRRLLQQNTQFFIRVDLFNGFGSLKEFDIQSGITLFVAPREENLQCACVAVD